MENKGYMSRVLNVDLSSGQMYDEFLSEQVCKDFIGGYGIGAKMLYDRMRPGVSPLAPENILAFFTGPLTGTRAFNGARFTVVCKSPLTDTWGDANCGGKFGPHLKFAGYDGVIFVGVSDKPTYLFINAGKAELRDASWLWGRDTYETEDLIQQELGRDVVSACIGPSGEKLSLIACVITDKGRAAGRSGVGAVMGSKKLKAIAVRGNLKVPVADKEEIQQLRHKYLKKFTDNYESLHRYGTIAELGEAVMSGGTPVKNWAGAGPTDFPKGAERFNKDTLLKYETKKRSCWGCNIACDGYMEVKSGPYAGTKCHKVEYETAAAFGTLCLNDNFPSLIKATDIVNRAGLDSISAGCVMAFAIECYENGLISKSDTDGLELRWGAHREIIQLLQLMANRQGFGDLLADGVRRAAERIGKGAERYAIHVHGQELPMWTPGFMPTLATSYTMDATPGRHTQDYVCMLTPQGIDIGMGGEAQKKGSALLQVVNASGACVFVYFCYHAQVLPDFLRAVTGWDLTMDDCFIIGERIANMRHAFNIREGLNSLEFKVPGRMIGIPPLNAGAVKDVTVDIDTQAKDFCRAMSWDTITGRPSARRLRELGLEYLVKDICKDA